MFRVQIRHHKNLIGWPNASLNVFFDRWDNQLWHRYQNDGFSCSDATSTILRRDRDSQYIIFAEKVVTTFEEAVAYQLAFIDPLFEIVIEEVVVRVQIILRHASRDAIKTYMRWNDEHLTIYQAKGFNCRPSLVAIADRFLKRTKHCVLAERVMTDVDAVAFQLSFNEPGFDVVIEEVSP